MIEEPDQREVGRKMLVDKGLWGSIKKGINKLTVDVLQVDEERLQPKDELLCLLVSLAVTMLNRNTLMRCSGIRLHLIIHVEIYTCILKMRRFGKKWRTDSPLSEKWRCRLGVWRKSLHYEHIIGAPSSC